jgi:hypothetical protein
MANMLDYIDWRGDLTFENSPFNDIDNVIFTQLAFVDFEGIVPPPSKRGEIALSEAAEKLSMASGVPSKLGVLVPGSSISSLFDKMKNSKRYCSLKLSAYINHIDYEKKIQFSAITIDIGDKTKYIAFRGTDDTLVGWQEDFNMSFLDTIAAQREAVAYVDLVSESCEKLLLGGHSKGGNLAVFAGVHCSVSAKRKLVKIFNNDGPGFSGAMLDNENYIAIKDKIRTFVPQSSVVGMLLERAEKILIVKSEQVGLLQHDCFSWQVMGCDFVYVDKLSNESMLIEKSVKSWIATMDPDQRKEFVDAFFAMLSGSDAKTLTDLSADKVKLLKSIISLSPNMRDVLVTSLKGLLSEGAKNLQDEIKSKRRKKNEPKT